MRNGAAFASSRRRATLLPRSRQTARPAENSRDTFGHETMAPGRAAGTDAATWPSTTAPGRPWRTTDARASRRDRAWWPSGRRVGGRRPRRRQHRSRCTGTLAGQDGLAPERGGRRRSSWTGPPRPPPAANVGCAGAGGGALQALSGVRPPELAPRFVARGPRHECTTGEPPSLFGQRFRDQTARKVTPGAMRALADTGWWLIDGSGGATFPSPPGPP